MKKIHQILSVILMICLVCASIGSVAAQNYDMLVDENIETTSQHYHNLVNRCSGQLKQNFDDKRHGWTTETGTIHYCDFEMDIYWTDIECTECTTYFVLNGGSHTEQHYGHTNIHCEFYPNTINVCPCVAP